MLLCKPLSKRNAFALGSLRDLAALTYPNLPLTVQTIQEPFQSPVEKVVVILTPFPVPRELRTVGRYSPTP